MQPKSGCQLTWQPKHESGRICRQSVRKSKRDYLLARCRLAPRRSHPNFRRVGHRRGSAPALNVKQCTDIMTWAEVPCGRSSPSSLRHLSSRQRAVHPRAPPMDAAASHPPSSYRTLCVLRSGRGGGAYPHPPEGADTRLSPIPPRRSQTQRRKQSAKTTFSSGRSRGRGIGAVGTCEQNRWYELFSMPRTRALGANGAVPALLATASD